MNVTTDLITRANGLLQVQPEINDWTGKRFSMFNTGSVEVETAEFLYAMVRLTKPQHILDTGTHYGVSALYMGQGLKDNLAVGAEVMSLELDKVYLDQAIKLWETTGLRSFITSTHGESLKFEPSHNFDLMLLDTEPQIRFQELIYFFPFLNPGGYVFIHDLHRHMSQEPNKEHGFGYPFGKMPKAIVEMLKEDELRLFHFPTPRGLAGFYKPMEGDYKYE